MRERSFGRRLIRCIFHQFEFNIITNLGQVHKFNCPRCGWLHTALFADPHTMSCETCGKTFVLRGVVNVHREKQ